MQNAKTMKDYRKDLREALDDELLRQTLDNYAVAYRVSREAVFAEMNEKELIAEISRAKAEVRGRYDELYEQFKVQAEKKGVKVHRAGTGAEANEIICRIARENRVKRVVKSKSMTGEEIHINKALETEGLEVVETDLGEFIIQLRHEGPSHMVMPAIHVSRHQVADTFSEATGRKQDSEIAGLVRVSRRALRSKFAAADMGITGANFAVAENGAVAICTNEGNGRLVATLPRVRVSICGLDKLTPTLHEALRVIKVLPRNATAQPITSYVSWMAGAGECALNPDGRQITHVVFLDNGRGALAKDPVCAPALDCVRCGACANVCPVFRLVGGHRMGHIYVGAIGLILTYVFHGRDKAMNLVQNCINCEACKDVCAAGIDLPVIIQEIRARLNEEEGAIQPSSLLGKVLANRKLFHSLLRFGKWAQRPATAGTPFIRHLPQIFMAGQGFRALPAIARTPFRDEWKKLKNSLPAKGKYRVGIFAGCAQDFIYPEQLRSAVELLVYKGCVVDFPMDQSCCGLPVRTMGERRAAEEVALRNVRAFAAGYDYVLSLCASCASYIKHNYAAILDGVPGMAFSAGQFTARFRDFSSFVRDVLEVGAADLKKTDDLVMYHASCHQCRGLGVREQPRALLAEGASYKATEEEEVCCGFGGTYSVVFPEISARILDHKLSAYEANGAGVLVTDCPGCVIQLRGGEERRGNKLRIEHMSEFLAGRLKK